MAPRVSTSELTGLITTSATSAAQDLAREYANDVVEQRLADEGYSEAQLERFEKYLALHALHAHDPHLSQVTTDDVRQVYEGSGLTESGLRETRYGRRALELDHTGNLHGTGKPPAKVEFFGLDEDSPGV